MSKGKRVSLGTAKLIATVLKKKLAPYCDEIKIAGSIRRARPTCGDIDIVLSPKSEGSKERIKEICLSYHPGADDVFSKPGVDEPKWGPKIATFNYKGRIPVDLYFATKHTFTTLLLIRTGSKQHNIHLCKLAKSLGKKLAADGSGLWHDRKCTELVPTFQETHIFRALDTKYLLPFERQMDNDEY